MAIVAFVTQCSPSDLQACGEYGLPEVEAGVCRALVEVRPTLDSHTADGVAEHGTGPKGTPADGGADIDAEVTPRRIGHRSLSAPRVAALLTFKSCSAKARDLLVG